MTVHHSLKLYQIVSKYIPQDESLELISEVEAVVRNQLQMETNTLATKNELFQTRDELRSEMRVFRDELKGDIHDLRIELKGDIHDLRIELKGDIHDLRNELKGDIHDLRSDMKNLELEMKSLEMRVERGFKDQLKWIIVLMLGFSSLIIGVLKFL